MLKTLNTKLAKLKKDVFEVSGNGKGEHFERGKLDNEVEVSGGEVNGNKFEDNDITEEKNYQKTSKSKKLSKSKKTIKSFRFLIPRAKLLLKLQSSTTLIRNIIYRFKQIL